MGYEIELRYSERSGKLVNKYIIIRRVVEGYDKAWNEKVKKLKEY